MSKSSATAWVSDVRRASAFQVAMLILDMVFGRTAFDQEVAYSDPPRHTWRWPGLSKIEDGSIRCRTLRVSEGEMYLRSNSSCCICAQYKYRGMKGCKF